jgi:hypothetical protein
MKPGSAAWSADVVLAIKQRFRPLPPRHAGHGALPVSGTSSITHQVTSRRSCGRATSAGTVTCNVILADSQFEILARTRARSMGVRDHILAAVPGPERSVALIRQVAKEMKA